MKNFGLASSSRGGKGVTGGNGVRNRFSPPKMNVKNRRSSAVTVRALSPASTIIHPKLWQKLEELLGGGEREPAVETMPDTFSPYCVTSQDDRALGGRFESSDARVSDGHAWRAADGRGQLPLSRSPCVAA